MQQRQLRLGDILDDYCPRERRLTNHAVVAMVGEEVIRTRCGTCDAEHEYKHAVIPRQRRKSEPAALAAPVVAAPKKVVHEAQTALPDLSPVESPHDEYPANDAVPSPAEATPALAASEALSDDDGGDREDGGGWGHRTLIRAQLPRQEGQPPIPRQAPDFTIRQPATGRPGRFRPRQPRGGMPGGGGMSFQGNRSNGDMSGQGRSGSGGGPRHQGGPGGSRPGRHPHQHQGQGRKRSK